METDHVSVEQRLLEAALSESGRAVVLDAGCGRTTRLRHQRDRIARIVGIDADEPAGRENPYLDEFVPGNLDDGLPFPDGAFDLVYANFVVEHLEAPTAAFKEWRRVLGPGGALVLVTSNRASPLMALGDRLPQRARLAVKRHGAGAEERNVYPTFYRANTPKALAAAASSAGFAPVEVAYVGTLHRYGARVPGAGAVLRGFERFLPEQRRSTIVASYR